MKPPFKNWPIWRAVSCAGLTLMVCAPVSAQDFALVKETEGIQVFNRRRPGSDLVEFRGVTRMKATLSSLVAVLTDTSSFGRWMRRCSYSQVAKRVDFFRRYTYLINSAPWPVSYRDLVVYSKLTQDPKSGSITISLEGRPDFLPPKEDLIRISRLQGYWRFTPVAHGEVEVVYQLFTDPGGYLPVALANRSAVDVPFGALRNIRKMVCEERYRNQRYPEIIESSGSR